MLGGISLAEGNISEMKTGEGKTLVATLPAYLNSSIGNKAILVTVNDYLAKRDAEWMRPIYEFLGLSVGIVNSNQAIPDKVEAYKSDVIYATNNELGFDYLRDNMAHSINERVQCSLDFAIVEEVDSILIDEAPTIAKELLKTIKSDKIKSYTKSELFSNYFIIIERGWTDRKMAQQLHETRERIYELENGKPLQLTESPFEIIS